MKRRMIAAALALLLAVGCLAALNITVTGTETPIEMQVLTSSGDRSAAEGLTVDYRVALDDYLRWYTRYSPATGGNQTDFHLTYSRYNSPKGKVGYLSPGYFDWKPACRIVDSADRKDPITSSLWKQLEKSENVGVNLLVYPIDYYDTYSVVLTPNADNGILLEDYSVGTSVQAVNFPCLQIPVAEDDVIELYCSAYASRNNDSMKLSLSGWMSCFKNRFTPYGVSEETGALVTVGFAADVEPDASWAPDGFGLWFVPSEGVTEDLSGIHYDYDRPAPEKARIVYPLDIATQRVVLLEHSYDGAYILLVTVEEERFVLHVLDGGDYHLVQRLELDEAEVIEGSTSHYLNESYQYEDLRYTEDSAWEVREDDSGNLSMTVYHRDYARVDIRQGENFAAVVAGSRLMLSTPAASGYQLEFSCDAPSFSYVVTDTERGWQLLDAAWQAKEDDLSGAVAYYQYYPTVAADYSMAYDGQRLAVAGYTGDYSGKMVVSIYDADGLQYAEIVHSSLIDQGGLSSRSYWSELWQEYVQDEDYRDWNLQPGTAWET